MHYVDELCRRFKIRLKTVWIPRCLNNVADILSKMIDYDACTAQNDFYQLAVQISGFILNFDRFANNWNTKCPYFNFVAYCVGSTGVNAFNYPWGGKACNWLFPPPRLIIPTVLHLQKNKGTGLLLIPQWKSAVFYPFLMDFAREPQLVNRWVLGGKNVFKRGIDNSTCFGPDFSGNVELWLFDFNI
jgi:hypothetical protein